MKDKRLGVEFLMTYGWAILVVLAALSVLVYFDIFNFNNNPSPQPEYETIQQQFCIGYGDYSENRTLPAGQIINAIYIDYLYNNPDADIFDINVIVNEKSINMLNLTISKVKYTIEGEEVEVENEFTLPCRKTITGYLRVKNDYTGLEE